jgi:hypothetical protein
MVDWIFEFRNERDELYGESRFTQFIFGNRDGMRIYS